MQDCIFCRIAAKEIPAQAVYEDDIVMAFPDIKPMAPVHVLIIPKKHISSLLDITSEDVPVIEYAVKAAQQIAKSMGLAEKGFRIVVNTGNDGGQTVHHLHWHVLGGRPMSWPPG